MFDFHLHTILSDGLLLPSEICQYYIKKGFKAIAITDHCDLSNIEFVVKTINRFIESLPEDFPLKVFSGVELTHLPVSKIKEAISMARTLGAKVVVVHGETITEPVPRGTNRAAIESGCDILAHPGLICEEDALLCSEKGIFLEISTRKGHCYTNGWVLKMAQKTGAKVLVNNDAHDPYDILSPEQMLEVLQGAGADLDYISKVKTNAEFFYQTLTSSST